MTHPEVELPAQAEWRWVVVNSSGGKDSQTALRVVVECCDRAGFPRDRIVVSHQCLGRMEWRGTLDLVKKQADHYGLRLMVSKARDKQGVDRSLLEHVRLRRRWPSNKNRYCTSDHKRGPGARVLTQLSREAPGAILHVFGFRADESPARSKKQPLVRNTRLTTRHREVWDWLPIHDWTLEQVWTDIKSSGVSYHAAYDLGMPRLSCVFCLSRDTEVVTRSGLRSLSELAGGLHQLLVPKVTRYGLSSLGSFKGVEVKSFGRQRLMEIRLRKERRTKVVLATPEHRWLVAERRLKKSNDGRHKGYDPTTTVKTTAYLAVGDKLRGVKAESKVGSNGPKMVPFAVAQGFVFGDGSRGRNDERPASLVIYSKGKDGVMLPFFPHHAIQDTNGNGKPSLTIRSLPRLWKDLPDFRESRAFLLSWLSGYFAADGCVSKAGQVKISSASAEAIQTVRSVAAVCGVGYGPATRIERVGKGKKATPLYTVTLDVDDLPGWFFHIKHHASRVEARLKGDRGHDTAWTVESVTDTLRDEEVFCAVVPGAAAFGLSDDLMTGNCIFAPRAALLIAGRANPDLLDEYCAVEEEIGHTFQHGQSLVDIREAIRRGEQPAAMSGNWNM